MKMTAEELNELCHESGGRFSVSTDEAAITWCRSLAFGHYENFPVASLLLPQSKRTSIAVLYSFARIADDIADEPIGVSSTERVEMLRRYSLLLESSELNCGNPIFRAFHSLFPVNQTASENDTIRRCARRLLDAFRYDADFELFANMDELLQYCSNSANPVGEAVLEILGYVNPETIALSNNLCTALQLTNFLQDISLDVPRGRITIPTSVLVANNLTPETLSIPQKRANLELALREIMSAAEAHFNEGLSLPNRVSSIRFRLELCATIAGGLTILRRCKKLGGKLLVVRPLLSIRSVPSLIVLFVLVLFFKHSLSLKLYRG